MSAVRKLDDAQKSLSILKSSLTDSSLAGFVKNIHETYDALLDEYSKKFGCGIGRTSLAKFKTNAKRNGNVDAINFLIWYEREFRTVRNDPRVSFLLESNTHHISDNILESCSTLLEITRNLVYHAYESF